MEERPVFRHELKYYISMAQYAVYSSRAAALCKRDVHAGKDNGEYKISSLYFDDRLDSAYHEKLSGKLERKKYRIRIYDDSDSFIRLERKNKVGEYICKESAVLTKEEALRLSMGDAAFLAHSPQQLCREFYVDYQTGTYRPKVIVQYDREAYVREAGDVRVTFDKRIRAGEPEDFWNPQAVFFTAIPEMMVMEVKFTSFLPQMITDMFGDLGGDNSAISKYVICRDQLDSEVRGVY